MQQHDPLPTDEAIVVVHTARSWTEAMVVRGLLESAGIASPELGAGNPSPLPELTIHLHGIKIYALESEAGRARQMIAEYFADLERDPEDELEGSDDT
jgi:hypothetical protein